VSTTTHSTPLSARLKVLAAAALFSTGGAVIKAVSFSGWQVATFRSAVAAIVLFLLMPEARRRPSLKVLAVGVSYATMMILFVQSNKLTTAASMVFLQSTAPLYVLLLSPWMLEEKIRPRDLVYMAVLGVGLGLFFVGLDPVSATAPNPFLGNLLALLSGVFWATTIIGLRALGRGAEEGGSWGPSAALWGSVFAFTMCFPFAFPVTSSRPVDWILVIFLGVFQIALAYILLLRGLENVRALEASLLLLLEPVLNPVWAWLVHGERPGAWSLTGGAIILLSTVVKSWLDTRSDAAVTSPP
jgi:drug/metabolite transporter, DME family